MVEKSGAEPKNTTKPRTQKLYEEHLKARGIDPSKAPAVNRELWGKS